MAPGADDYINKPFNTAELVLRVHIGRRIVGLETRDMTIFALAELAESRDPETGATWNVCGATASVLASACRTCPAFRGRWMTSMSG